jgi:hypothetical protein
VADEDDFAGEIGHFSNDFVDHRFQGDILERGSILALARKVYCLGAVTPLFQLGGRFAPAPSAVKRAVN